MSLFRGSLSYVRFFVNGELPPGFEDRALGIELLARHDSVGAMEGVEAEIAEEGGRDERQPEAAERRRSGLAGDHGAADG